ncbi:MAG: hypothetical protein IJ222_07840 [Bacteroidales bacterium]|nr:hypothetical protein [Bacteroidales bacterium]
MKRFLAAAALAFCLAASAQTTAEQFKARYSKLVANVGEAGVGVEYLLDKWAAAYPDDTDMLEARYQYYFAKSRTEEVKRVDAAKYLGQKPVLTLKDSLGADVNYFVVPQFNDSLFRMSQKCIERAMELRPDLIRYRFDKIAALTAYEKDSPDMAATEMLNLIDYDQKARPAWIADGEAVTREEFEGAVQEYCFVFYRIGSASSYESFRVISERMLKVNPRSTLFLNNLGAYWQVAKRNDKTAAKYYKKALKIDPSDATAKANMAVIERNAKKKKK